MDEYLAMRDPLVPVKMRVNLIIKALDNEILCTHLNQMTYAIVDLSAAPDQLLTSDRPVQFFNLKEPYGLVSMPISPTKLFVAVNEEWTFDKLRRVHPRKIVREVNTYVVSRARRFVWAQDSTWEEFVANTMGTNLEPTPLFPGIGHYEPPPSHVPLADPTKP